MKIGANSTIFNNLKLSDTLEVKESTENSNLDESQNIAADIPKIQPAQKPERLNLLAGNFMRADSDGEKNYSLLNLKALKAQDSLMVQFNSMITSVVNYRVYRTEELIESGLPPDLAKGIAGGEAKKMGDAASKKIVGDMTEDTLEKEVKEQKEFTEEQIEKVVTEKQEDKAIEAKEEAAKKEESLTESTDPLEESQNKTSEISIQSEASITEGVIASSTASDQSETGDTIIKNIIKTGEHVDVLV